MRLFSKVVHYMENGVSFEKQPKVCPLSSYSWEGHYPLLLWDWMLSLPSQPHILSNKKAYSTNTLGPISFEKLSTPKHMRIILSDNG